MGTLLEIEVSAIPATAGKGQFTITGVVDEEELGGGSRTLRSEKHGKRFGRKCADRTKTHWA